MLTLYGADASAVVGISHGMERGCREGGGGGLVIENWPEKNVSLNN